ncbi:homoserine dehydrogenase [Marinilabiliaceae bacterium ANBcel2]|nr:homoserine dehydrogenase [Marinilabiliaceae bacterium ANBcel2]
MSRQSLKIGVFGFGVVGQGLYEVMQKSPALDDAIVKICVKNRKERSLPDSFFCYNPDEILKDDSINTVVELINDHEAAYTIVKGALESGKNVVSANKKMIAENMEEMIALQKKNNVSLLYEASACGSIPIVRSLEEYYDNDLLTSVTGILNGSSNYILSRIFDNNQEYDTALREAQELGYAEADPVFDVGGFDSLYKLIILTMHSFGIAVNPEDVLRQGISHISDFDINYAKEKGLKIKLAGQVERLSNNRITLFVLPRLVGPEKYIYSVDEEFNGVVIKGLAYDKQFMFGKGAGGNPTGSAVLSDITALMHNYKYEYKKAKYFEPFTYCKDAVIEIYLRTTNPEDLELFGFQSVSEEYHGPDASFVTGMISMNALLEAQEILNRDTIFIAATGKALNY